MEKDELERRLAENAQAREHLAEELGKKNTAALLLYQENEHLTQAISEYRRWASEQIVTLRAARDKTEDRLVGAIARLNQLESDLYEAKTEVHQLKQTLEGLQAAQDWPARLRAVAEKVIKSDRDRLEVHEVLGFFHYIQTGSWS